jgi:hypothetical protein
VCESSIRFEFLIRFRHRAMRPDGQRVVRENLEELWFSRDHFTVAGIGGIAPAGAKMG